MRFFGMIGIAIAAASAVGMLFLAIRELQR
jgi:hypothetical protein